MVGTCLCGATRVTIETKPEFIHDCNCNLCRKTGGAWAYFSTAQVQIAGETVSVMRNDKENPAAEVHSCAACYTTTHFGIAKSFTDKHGPIDMVGVNMRLFEVEDINGVEVRFPNGKDWVGEGPFEYRRAPVTLGEGSGW